MTEESFRIADGRINFKDLGSYNKRVKIQLGFHVNWRRSGWLQKTRPKRYKCISRDHAKHRRMAHTRMKKVR